MTEPDLRQMLRTETKASHRQLDERMNTLDLFGSPQHYAAYLSLMGSLHAAVADAVNRVAGHLDLPGNGDLIRSIDQDLQSTGHSSLQLPLKADQRSALPIDSRQRFDSSEPTASDWGAAYVMEGSSMGGVFLYRQAQQKLSPGIGTEFLRRLSTDAENRWPRFIDGLRAADLAPEQTIASAKATFRQAEAFLDQILGRLPAVDD